ncbi:hypothetical protein HR060_06440 [Catenovulum sp. SM1970]|uniref:hypothetical protein n=1 Tax=Marinifaba aquimaris TaxID=2741323 RepID=UPI0015725116|nr:hypothetical protein [Marinifaba aquimaris]NTS76505.1 hypothetical protein [Marinifaba aquimaris]
MANRTIALAGKAIKADLPKSMTIKMLEQKLPIQHYDVLEPWNNQVSRFSGFLLSDIAAELGTNKVSQITLTAIDNYQVTYRASEWQQEIILLASKEEGKAIPIGTKGQLRTVYPANEMNYQQDPTAFSKWMWVVKRIELN